MKINKLTLHTALLAVLIISQYSNTYATDSEDESELEVKFIDVTEMSGINYRRTESARDAILDQFKQPGAVLTLSDIPFTPGNSRGNPGVAIFDFDNDGDLDIYATNGPGTSNSLYSNQMEESDEFKFIDVAESAGVSARMQDSAGVCFADIDNDGDEDLFVLGSSEKNRLFVNNGNGVYTDISEFSETGEQMRNSIGCSFGDINGDGLVDLVIANLGDSFDNRLALMVPGFEHLKEHNELYLNKGNNEFENISEISGIENFRGASWAIAMVDYDMDGDADIVIADDQATRIPASAGGEDFGYIRIYQNDGSGQFSDKTEHSGMNKFGDWMGLSFGDLNSDGYLDIFATNIGDYLAAAVGPALGLPTGPNDWSSRWFLGQHDGTFTDPGIGSLKSTPFGWGTSMTDYDNDGDLDIIYHGGADMAMLIDSTNPGTIMKNSGSAEFEYDISALLNSTNHLRRNVHGMAVGDLNKDGTTDIVSISSMNWPEPFPLVPIVPAFALLGSDLDDSALIWPVFRPHDENPDIGFVWNGMEPTDGTLSIELNKQDENKSLTVHLMGSYGIVDNAKVNRDGIGAIITVRSDENIRTTVPVVSGGSHASSDSFVKVFGLGESNKKSVIDIMWPGGVKNRYYGAKAGNEIFIPEIPCSYDDVSMNKREYKLCVKNSLHDLEEAGMIEHDDFHVLFKSAIKAYKKNNHFD